MLPADKVAFRSLVTQRTGQRQAAHDVARADFQGRIGTEGDLHSPPWSRCRAMNISSARRQSSSVSMSWTR